MMIRLLTIALIAAAPVGATADEQYVYESFAGVQIGRVFLTQSQRDALDAARLLGPQEGESETTADAKPGEPTKVIRPAGYIIGSSGRSRVWQDGDFVETGRDAARALRFPGDIRITRHKTAAAPAADESTGGGDDDAR